MIAKSSASCGGFVKDFRMKMTRKSADFLRVSICILLLLPSISSHAQQVRPGAAAAAESVNGLAITAASNSYADMADLVVAVPLIVDVAIRKTTAVPATQAIGVPANMQRMLVLADVMALLRGTDGIGGQVRFLLDVPKDAKGKLPKLKKQRLFLFASRVANMPGTIRLIKPNALAAWSPANDSLVRAITREAVQIDAPQAITGIASAFHSAGSVPGEGDSQIFLNSAGGQPYSISVISRTGKAKSWSVSNSELIEEGAGAPKRTSLLWYRLACGLPPKLGADQLEGADEAGGTRLQADYAFVLSALGRCDRTRR
jgi:hypothetical protein